MKQTEAKSKFLTPEASGRTKWVVLNELTLGYMLNPHTMGVLSAKIGGYSWKNGNIAVGPNDNLRPATLADFAAFRVDPTGYAIGGK